MTFPSCRTTCGTMIDNADSECEDLLIPGEPTPLAALKSSMLAALETYSNVHRGSGQFSQVTTHLYEQARQIILDLLGLRSDTYTVVFCTPQRMHAINRQLRPEDYHALTSRDAGLALGVCALSIRKSALHRIRSKESGGGVVRLVSRGWTVWEKAPDRLEAGTPPVINVLGFVRALQLIQQHGMQAFQKSIAGPEMTAENILFQDSYPASGRALMQRLRETMIGKSIAVPTSSGRRTHINLDNGASTPALEPVWQATWSALCQPAATQRELIRMVCTICSKFLDAPEDAYEIVFCSSTTEAINLAAELLPEPDPGEERVILNSLLEHHSNELPWREISDANLLQVGMDHEGFMDLVQMENLLHTYNMEHKHGRKRIRLVAVTAASNVLGTFTDLEAVSALTRKYGAHLLVDGAQAAAHRSISLSDQQIDYFAFSAHKVYAPFGSGALVIRKSLLSGDNEHNKRLHEAKLSGEENAIGITALGKALLLIQRIGLDCIAAEEQRLTAMALHEIASMGAEIFGVQSPDSSRFLEKGPVIAFSLPTVPHNLAVRELAEEGATGVRNGCFCAHLAGKHLMRINTLRERLADLGMILFPKFTGSVLPGMIRISIGLENDEDDLRVFAQTLQMIAEKRRSRLDLFTARMYNGTPVLPPSSSKRELQAFIAERVQLVFSSTPQSCSE